MNIVMWILAGGALGWAGFRLLGINQRRGTLVSIVIGALGGLIGGQMLSPMMSSSPIVSGDFNVQALFIAAVAGLVTRRFGWEAGATIGIVLSVTPQLIAESSLGVGLV